MIFKIAYVKESENKNLLKLQDDNINEGKAFWAETSPKVVSYARSNYEEGDEIGVDYTVYETKSGAKKFKVIKINQDNSINDLTNGKKPSSKTSNKKPYTNTKKTKSTSSKSDIYRDPETIRKNEVFKACCRAVTTLTGRFDNVDSLVEALEILFDKFEEKTK